MNRRDRRAASRRRIHDLWRAVEDTGLPGVIHGLHSACRDCDADGELVILPDRRVVANIFHDDGCPALTARHLATRPNHRRRHSMTDLIVVEIIVVEMVEIIVVEIIVL